jgi:hypothetical protein
MTDPDDRLEALFAADLPPLRDPAFQTEVLAAVMRRKFLAELGLALAMSAIGALTLGVLWPALSPALASVGRTLLPAAIAVVAAVSILAFTSGRSLGLSA